MVVESLSVESAEKREAELDWLAVESFVCVSLSSCEILCNPVSSGVSFKTLVYGRI